MSQRLSKPFWPPALVQQAPPAIILAVLRRFRGPALFRGLRPCPSPGAPFWPSGLTRRSSRPAYGGRLTLAVSPITRFMRAPTCSSARPCCKGFQAFWASSACQPSATSYHACSAAPLSWPSAFSWAAPLSKSGRLTLPLFRVALNPRFTRPFCAVPRYAVPRTSAARTASG